MATPPLQPQFRVLIAGGGVAALEAVLALHAIDDGSLDVQLLSPDSQFGVRAMSVVQPFGSDPSGTLDLEAFCREHGATHLRGSLAEVWGEQQRILTDAGEELFYDALLVAIGARARFALPGSRAFRGAIDVPWFEEMLAELESGSIRHLTFSVPGAVRWSLPLYELALLTAHRLRDGGKGDVELTMTTPEHAPLEVFGADVGARIEGLLTDAGVELLTGRIPVAFDGEALHFEEGDALDTRCVVALPEPWVPAIPGVPQGSRGFIGCDPQMRVDGLQAVWVAGDASWMPIKQGGLAAQEAEVAAWGIAKAAGFAVESKTFRPVIRGALLTGSEPRFLRTEEEGVGEISSSPIWWPPAKLAAPRLGPYLAARSAAAGPEPEELEDLQGESSRSESEGEHREALRLALSYAEVDAREGEMEDALRWLDVAERLNVTLPFEYQGRREDWRRLADGSARHAE